MCKSSRRYSSHLERNRVDVQCVLVVLYLLKQVSEVTLHSDKTVWDGEAAVLVRMVRL